MKLLATNLVNHLSKAVKGDSFKLVCHNSHSFLSILLSNLPSHPFFFFTLAGYFRIIGQQAHCCLSECNQSDPTYGVRNLLRTALTRSCCCRCLLLQISAVCLVIEIFVSPILIQKDVERRKRFCEFSKYSSDILCAVFFRFFTPSEKTK